MLIIAILIPFILFLFFVYTSSKKTDATNNELINSKFTEEELHHEKITRKHWLISYYLIILYDTVKEFPSLIVNSQFLTDPDLITLPAFLNVLGISSIGFAISYLFYYCAYLRNGTIWLLLTIIFLPFSLIALVMAFPKLEWNIYVISVCIVKLGIEGYFWFNCFKLRGFNSKRFKIKMDQEVYP